MSIRARLLVVVLAALLAACGAQSPTAEPEPQGAAAGSEAPAGGDQAGSASAAGERLQEIYAELEGLEGDARRERLLELAREEEDGVSYYGSANIEDIKPVLDAFEDYSGLTVSHYRAGADTILNRVAEEAAAGFSGADVIQVTTRELPVLEEEGHLLPLETPVRELIIESGRSETWLATQANAYIAAWNTDRVTEADRPTTWEEVLAWDGVLSMDVRDFDWFATLVKHYFVGELGMTEDEAVQLFMDAAPNTIFVNGHSIGSQMLVAGEFDINATMYHHHTSRFPADAPYAWEPPVEPIVLAMSGLGISSMAERPASALLLSEFVLTDGQPILAESGRTVANTTVEGGLSPEYKTIGIDMASLGEEREKWEGLFEQIALQSGREIVE